MRGDSETLDWQPGDRLTLTAAAGVVIARCDPGGLVTMSAKPCLVIPAALRRRCGLRPGDRVLLAVFPAQEALAAYSFAVRAMIPSWTRCCCGCTPRPPAAGSGGQARGCRGHGTADAVA